MLSKYTPGEYEDEWIQNNVDFKWLWMVSSITASENPAQSFHVKNGSLVRKLAWQEILMCKILSFLRITMFLRISLIDDAQNWFTIYYYN